MKRGLVTTVRNRFVRRTTAERCVASGWQLRRSCSDGQGRAICPACTQPVRLRPPTPCANRGWQVESHHAA